MGRTAQQDRPCVGPLHLSSGVTIQPAGPCDSPGAPLGGRAYTLCTRPSLICEHWHFQPVLLILGSGPCGRHRAANRQSSQRPWAGSSPVPAARDPRSCAWAGLHPVAPGPALLLWSVCPSPAAQPACACDISIGALSQAQTSLSFVLSPGSSCAFSGFAVISTLLIQPCFSWDLCPFPSTCHTVVCSQLGTRHVLSL